MRYLAIVNGNSVGLQILAVGYSSAPEDVIFDTYPTDDEVELAFPELTLAKRKAEARIAISAAAEAARLQFITGGAGKAMSYQEKAKEATELLAAGQGTAEQYPLIFAEVGITAAQEAGALGVAKVVVDRYRLFRQIEALIGGLEAASQKAVNLAKSAAEIDTVLSDLTWPRPA